MCLGALFAPTAFTFAIFVAKIWFQSIHESSPKGVQTCHVRETLRFLPQGLLTSFEEMSNFQCRLGWGLSVGCYLDSCTQIYTRVGLGVTFNVHHMKYALHSDLYHFSPPHFISLRITAQNNPFKAHNDSTWTRLPALKY